MNLEKITTETIGKKKKNKNIYETVKELSIVPTN